MQYQHRVAACVAVMAFAVSCSGPITQSTPKASPQVTSPQPPVPSKRTEVTLSAEGLTIEPLPGDSAAAGDANAVELSNQEVASLLARVAPLPPPPQSTAMVRPPSAAPPAAAVATPLAFAMPKGAAVTDRPVRPRPVQNALAPPQVLPVGDVERESEIRVRFDQPMVAVEKIGTTTANVATIEPHASGTWRWLDTRVAVFTASAPYLAMATHYKITVPAGTRALDGAVTTGDTVASFSTAPVAIAEIYPSTIRNDSPIAIQLNQDVDPSAIAPFIRVSDVRGRPIAFQLISLDRARSEWERNPSLSRPKRRQADAMVFGATWDAKTLGKRVVAIAPTSAWPADAKLTVKLNSNAPSAEGRRLATTSSERHFNVVPVFALKHVRCQSENYQPQKATCARGAFASLNFSNPIDERRFRADMVKWQGKATKDGVVKHDAIELLLDGSDAATHVIEIMEDISDVYGQRLARRTRATIATTRIMYAPVVIAAEGMQVLDPRFRIPQYVIQSQAIGSLHVELYRVRPEDFFQYEKFEEAPKRNAPPGKRVWSKTYTVGARAGGVARVDLRPALDEGHGHAMVVTTVTPTTGVLDGSDLQKRWVAWIQVSQLAVSARVDGERVHAWASDIAPTQIGRPREDVAFRMLSRTGKRSPSSALTNRDGAATIELPVSPERRGNDDQDSDDDDGFTRYNKIGQLQANALLVASQANESVFVPINSVERSQRVRSARWFVTDDRFTYRPGEPLYIKGWVRWTHDGVNPGLELPQPSDRIDYVVRDVRNVELASGTAGVTDQGGFDFAVNLPANANLGDAKVTLTTNDETFDHRFAIQEFRTPNYSIELIDDIEQHGAAPVIVGEALQMSVAAHYYAGGGLPGAPVKWVATLKPASYRPPGWSDFHFEPVRERTARAKRPPPDEPARIAGRQTLGADSSARARFSIHDLPVKQPTVLAVDATVTDADGQTIRAESTKFVVHPAALYVGVRLKPHTTDTLEAVVTDPDGRLVPGIRISVTAHGTSYSRFADDDGEVRDTQRCSMTSASEPTSCLLLPRRDHELTYRVVATIQDSRGRGNGTAYELPFWSGSTDPNSLSIRANRELYQPGDRAQLEIRSSVVPSSAVVTFARQGVIAQRRLELRQERTQIELPIEPQFLQNVHVQVDRIARQAQPDLDRTNQEPIAEHESADLELAVDADASRLTMRTWPVQPIIEPGQTAGFEIEVIHRGKPVANAEVALIVVDEAILALSGRHHENPLGHFFYRVEAGTTLHESLSTIREVNDFEIDGSPGFERSNLDDGTHWLSGFGTGAGYGSGRGTNIGAANHSQSTIYARQKFHPNALFSPTLHTDARGRARASVKLPDSLTRYRIIAIASAGTYRFGIAESAIVAQRKVNARTQAPRFATQGDTFEVPVLVQNLGAAPRSIDVAVRASNLAGSGGKRVTVLPGQRTEVRFAFATMRPGKAAIQTVIAPTGSETPSDASIVEFPVYAPATTETVATYGVVDAAPAVERLVVPNDIHRDIGGIETEIAATQLQNLTDAFLYLYRYPFECAEQRSSRMLATAALSDVLDLFAVPGRSRKTEFEEQARHDVDRLVRDQNEDRGWGYWRGTPSDPFVSMQVVTALRAHNYTGPAIASGIAYVQAFLAKQLAVIEAAQRGDHVEANVTSTAIALAALTATGSDQRRAAQRLHTLARRIGEYPVEAKARLLALVAGAPAYREMRRELAQDLVNASHETAAGAVIETPFSEAEKVLLASNDRTTALALDALIKEQPTHPMIAKLARGLLTNRKAGRWRSTQDNLVVTRAMRRFFDTYEKQVPNYVAKQWVGTVAYTEHQYVARSLKTALARMDWTALAPGSSHDVTFAKTGPGRMYYRVAATYAPNRVDVSALDAGFVVRRSYVSADQPSDVVKISNGYRVKRGATVKIALEVINTAQRDNVALVDPLPAGLELVNTALATSERSASKAPARDWVYVQARDNRSEAFASTLAAGTHYFEVTARATTPGTFVVAPAKAEEMYAPETFGRSNGMVVTVQ